MNLNNFFDKVYRLVVTLAAIWAAYILSSIFLAPAAFEVHNVSPVKVHTLCPGQTFSYKSETTVRARPVTLVKTETWFSVAQQNNVIPDNFNDMEVFNWDSKVPAVIPRVNTITVPGFDKKGNPLSPGNYRYISNIQRLGGDSKTNSISIEVIIPANCS